MANNVNQLSNSQHRRGKNENLFSLSPPDTPIESLYTPSLSPVSTPKLEHKSFSLPVQKTSPSKAILSFLLSPTGYKLLGYERASQKNDSSMYNEESDTTNANTQITSEGNSKGRYSRLNDPEKYSQRLKSQIQSSSSASSPTIPSRSDDISSAARAGIRGFALVFLAGAIMDIILPALLKRNFKGLLLRIATDVKTLRFGLSAGSFALVYKIVFRYSASLLDKVLNSSSRLRPATKRTDSGIYLGIDNDSASLFSQQLSQQGDSRKEEEILRRSKRIKWMSAIIASLAAMPAFALIPQHARRLTFAMYFLTYAGETAYAVLENAGYTDWMPSWLGIWVLFPISNSFCVHALIEHTDISPSSMVKTITSQGNPYILRPSYFKSSVYGSYPSAAELFSAARNAYLAGPQSIPITASSLGSATASAGTFLASEPCIRALQATEGMGYDSMACRLYHPTSSYCTGAMMQLIQKYSKLSLKFYTMFSIFTFVLRGGRVFQNGILDYLGKTGIQIFRSVFATTCVMATAFSMVCLMGRTFPSNFLPTKR
ncbi:hypothetical protein BGZ46_004082 [Entomortierella lignicola]|nr:hypothetical protein BGZ46_004082 [Entomortierella lignicola]